MRKLLFVFIALIFLYGCSTVGKVLNPYEDEFSCPKTSDGKCVSVKKAYNESIETKENNSKIITQDDKDLKSLIVETKEKTSMNTYENIMFDKMTSLLKEPNTPIVVPPTVIRILMLPYVNDNSKELFMPRYIYFFADDPKWIMGDYLFRKENE